MGRRRPEPDHFVDDRTREQVRHRDWRPRPNTNLGAPLLCAGANCTMDGSHVGAGDHAVLSPELVEQATFLLDNSLGGPRSPSAEAELDSR